jgi:hypothetical protein
MLSAWLSKALCAVLGHKWKMVKVWARKHCHYGPKSLPRRMCREKCARCCEERIRSF